MLVEGRTNVRNEARYLLMFLQQRAEWLYQVMGERGGTGADNINVTMQAEWAYPED